MKTTLNQIRACHPCLNGWSKLLRNLGKTGADDEPLSIIQVLDSNGIDDALWCFQAVKGFEREKRLYAVRCARRVQHLMTDKRSLDALDVSERFAHGTATQKELDDAVNAAKDAAWDSGMDAAADAARDAVRASEWAARDAARGAAWAASDAVMAASNAARAAEWAVQENYLREMCADCEVAA